MDARARCTQQRQLATRRHAHHHHARTDKNQRRQKVQYEHRQAMHVVANQRAEHAGLRIRLQIVQPLEQIEAHIHARHHGHARRQARKKRPTDTAINVFEDHN